MRYLTLTFTLLVLTTFLRVAHAQVNVATEFVPTNTTLVWEADSYTPPFYRGKALYPDGGTFRIVAFPPEGLSSPELLTYTWEVDGKVMGSLSGVGRRTFVFEGTSYSGSPLIVVRVSSAAGNHGVGATRVPTIRPGVLLYEDVPLLGIRFNEAFWAPPSDEIAIETYPLFFSTQTRSAERLRYSWSADDVPLQNPLGNSPRIVVRTENPGTTTLSVRLQNSAHILESARGEMILHLTE